MDGAESGRGEMRIPFETTNAHLCYIEDVIDKAIAEFKIYEEDQ